MSWIHFIVQVLLEGGELKYWVSPSGGVSKCDTEHGAAACKILGIPFPRAVDKDELLMRTSEVRDRLVQKGYVRINILPGRTMYADHEKPLTPDQEHVILAWAKRLGVEVIGI